MKGMITVKLKRGRDKKIEVMLLHVLIVKRWQSGMYKDT